MHIYIFLNESHDSSCFELGVHYKKIHFDNTWHAPILKSLIETFTTANNTLVKLWELHSPKGIKSKALNSHTLALFNVDEYIV